VSNAARPTERSRLSERDVIDAALRLTRRKGLAQLSMRGLAEEAGVATMATYHYVKSKEALLDLVADEVLEMVEIPSATTGDWAERVGELNSRMRRVLLDYPGLGSYLMQRPLTEAGRRLSEASLQLLGEGGFEEREAQLAASMFQAFLLGRMSVESAVAARRSGGRSDGGSHKSRLSADEVFEYGIAQLVTWLRFAASAPK